MSFVFNHHTAATGPFRTFLRQHGSKVAYNRGDTIVAPGDNDGNVFYIEQGFIKVYSLTGRNEQYVHAIYGSSEIFPLALLTNPLPPTVYYDAFTDCKLTRIPRSAVVHAMHTDIDLTREFAERAITQFRLYSARVDNLQYKFARERLVYRLLFLVGRFGEKQADGSYIIQAPMTQQLIGDSINLSRESVSREFDRLRSLGLIGYQEQSLVVYDWQKLSQEFKEPVHAEWWGLE